MSKNTDIVKEVKAEVKKTASRARKAAGTAVADNKAKLTETIKEAKVKTGETAARNAEVRLEKAVNNKMRIHVEHYGKQVSEEDIAKRLFEALKKNGFKGTIKTLNIYYKAEENTAYCVVNEGEPVVLQF